MGTWSERAFINAYKHIITGQLGVCTDRGVKSYAPHIQTLTGDMGTWSERAFINAYKHIITGQLGVCTDRGVKSYAPHIQTLTGDMGTWSERAFINVHRWGVSTNSWVVLICPLHHTQTQTHSKAVRVLSKKEHSSMHITALLLGNDWYVLCAPIAE